ncbi:hypothetical protein LHV00_00150 [Bifidobacterium longum subsp. infantis]|uniref:hypothetical protein n=2 Tax=Bifidobacterium longum TaxID=216816 RepID=UPI001CFF652A|nr:hypothetical protein [Bifidobacterium longum]MCB5304535.1 hypothetical protein [Bifidobacterium longum subsp. infantis]
MQRINLYPSPLTPLVNDGTGDITHGDYDVAIDNLEAGTYVFAADIQNSGTQTGINVMLFDSGWNPLFSSDKIGHVQTTFTFKKPDRVRIRAFQNGVTISNVIVERADTYALTSGGGFRASSPQAPRRTELEGGGGHQLRVSVPRRVPRPAWRGARNVPDGLFS